MKIPLTKILLVSLATLIFLTTPLAAAKSQVRFDELQEISAGPKELLMPGRAEGSGTSFAIKDSEYLNINLKSEKEIKIVLESIPRMISINIEASATTASTSLTLEGLEPNKTYYQYQDSYKNEAVFISNSNGSFSWGQDLTQPHHIWLQEIKSTVFLPEDCSKYGIWDGTTSTCTLTQDLTESVEITENNITLDCNGHSITGQLSGYGIYLNNKSGINIKNCGIFHFTTGISLLSSFSNNLLNNTISNNGWYGIYVGWSNTNTISNNTLSNNNNGIVFYQSDNNDVVDNTLFDNFVGIFSGYSGDNPNNNNLLARNVIFNNHYGLLIEFSTKNTLTQNKMFNNRFNFFLNGIFDSHFDHDIDLSNTTDGKPIYYLKNIENKIYDSSTNAGIFYCVSCNNVTLKDLTLTKNGLGILFWKTQNSKIENNIISDNWFHGIYLGFSDSNLITKNTLSNNTQGGSSSLGFKGEYFTISSSGIHFRHSSDNTFTLNNLLKEGLWLLESSNNQSYHNNFRERLFAIIAGGSNNLFDDDYPSGGNYWSDYVGVDEKSGGNQDQPGLDGIGDTPYTFYGGQDRYPFMKENSWGEPPPPEEPEKWSFAIITDLHIGKDDPDNDYNGPTWDDLSGESYSSIDNVTTREYLRQIVDIINTKRELYNIDFVVVTGDIADSAELSEFKEAIEILNQLEIPWLPIIGNHDVWPFYGPIWEVPNPYEKMAPEVGPGNDGTDRFFNEMFNSQYEKLSEIFQNWEKTDISVWNPETNPEHYSYFQNFAFDYDNYHFIGLDFNDRDNMPWPFKGVSPGGNLYNFSDGTWDWFTKHLDRYISEYSDSNENIILFAHHPLRNLPMYGFSGDELDKIQSFLTNYADNVFAEFAGHTHPKQLKDHWLLSGNLSRIMRVIEIPTNSNSSFALLVQLYPEGKIDYSEILGYELIITAKSPVDLVITDPDNLTISKELNKIPGATYMEMDIDGDGFLDDWVGILERKLGNYQIKTTPKPGATPADTYTLEISTLEDSFGYTSVILAENVPISGIPTVPYIFESKEKETTQLVYTGDLGGQYSDSINLSAILTDGDGNPLANKKIVFEIGEQSNSAITNENGIATISSTLNQIPGKYYCIDTTFPGDEDYLPSFDSNSFEILGSAKWFKKDAIGDLEAISTTNKHAQEDIEEAIKYINQSLNESLWSDASHLEPQHGHKIFDEEKMAVQYLMKITEERGEHTDPAIVEEVRVIIKKLIKADEKLAVVAIFDVKNIPLQDPKFNDKVDLEIIKAEEELNKAHQEIANNRSDKAIDNFKKAWEHVQLAIKFANLEKKP